MTPPETSAAWADMAKPLAHWAFSRLIVRQDVYGAYKPDGGQYTAHEALTLDLVARHFRGEVVLGFHSTSPAGECLTLTFDIDAHDDKADPEANWRYALVVADRLKELGLVALICDSNGRGGFHVRVFFKKPVPAEVAYWLGTRVVADWSDHGMAKAPEFFPKQPELTLATPYGNWLRGPGRHHKRPHWTRIFDPKGGRWLDGQAAAERLIQVAGDSPAMVLAAFETERKAREQAEPDGPPAKRLNLVAGKSGPARRGDKADEATVRSALAALPVGWADSYGGERADTGWLGVGMALHDWDPVRGIALWEEFSARCPTKYDAGVCGDKWATFTQGVGLTIGTVFREAERNGWEPPWRRNGAAAVDVSKDWPMLRLGVLPPAPAFPLDVLPDAAARLATEAAASIGCDPGIVAGPMLAAAGGLIGQSARLMLEANRFAGACLFQCNVGLPGDGKTPALMYATDPLVAIERDLDADFQRRKREYLDQVQKKKGGEEPAQPPPVPRRIIIDDATIEAAIRILANNPRGLVLLKDELSAMVLGLNQYKGGKGNDRPNLMKMWAGAPVLIDRVLNEFQEPIRVPHPHLCITGNLPPAMLAELVNPKGDDGFIDRWLFVFPDRLPKLKTAQRRPVSDEAIRDWAAVADRLWGLDLRAHEKGPVPHVIRLSAAARSTFESRHDEHVDEVNDPGFPDSLRGPWSKLEAYAGRFTLILARLWDSTGERTPSPEVDQARVRGAWELASYFKDHGRRVRAHLEGRGLGGVPDGAKLILNWIKNHPDATAVTDRDISRSYPPGRRYDPIVMQDGLGWLAERHALRVAPAGPRPEGKPGRPAGATWELHPSLRDRLHNQQNQRNGGCQPGSSGGSADSADCAAPPEFLGEEEEVAEWTA